MTDAILCSPHFADGKPVFGLRIDAVITVTHPDGRREELSGGGDLCEGMHARPFLAAIEYLRAAGEPPVIRGEIERPKPKPKPAPLTPPAPPAAQVVQQQDTFMCGQCVKPVPYMSRGRHAQNHLNHKGDPCKVWEIRWLPLFDITGWPVCEECGLAIGTSSGMAQHEKKAGPPHRRAPEPYYWTADDMKTPMGAAFAAAIGK